MSESVGISVLYPCNVINVINHHFWCKDCRATLMIGCWWKRGLWLELDIHFFLKYLRTLIATYNNRKSMNKLKLDSKMSNCTEDLSVSNVRSSILKLHFCDSKYDTIIYNWTGIWLKYDLTNNEYVTGLLVLLHWRVLLLASLMPLNLWFWMYCFLDHLLSFRPYLF